MSQITRICPVVRKDTKALFLPQRYNMTVGGEPEYSVYKRPSHAVGALNFPMTLENFLSTCEVPGQVPFNQNDIIDPDSIVISNFEFLATHFDQRICVFGEVKGNELYIGDRAIGHFHHVKEFNPQTNKLKVFARLARTDKGYEFFDTFITPCGFAVHSKDLKDIQFGFYVTATVSRKA